MSNKVNFKEVVNFNYTSNSVDYVKQKIEDNLSIFKNVLNLKQEEKTYENIVDTISKMDEELNVMITPYFHLNSVDNSEETQKLYSDLLPILNEYGTYISQNIEYYKLLKELLNNTSLNAVERKVVEDMIFDYEISGVTKDEKVKKRLQEINLKLSELSQSFSQNVLNATNDYSYIIDNEEDLIGLPQSDIESSKFVEDGKTKYKFTLQMPSYIAYMTYGPNEKIREELYKAYVTRAPQNEEIIEEILSLKDEKVKLLGFDNYAQYSVTCKSAPNETEVIKFLEDLGNKSKDKAKEEFSQLEKFARESFGKESLNPWDTTLYSEKYREKYYDLNEEEYRPYFEKNNVVNGLFKFIEQLWKIRFVEVSDSVWSEKVTVYELYNEENKVISKLYLDLEARENKQGGAWMNNWHSKLSDQNPSAYVVCNFPTSNENTPSLLRHGDVVTLFHEMGHALHHLLTKIEEPSVGGVHVDWDVVEYPSQFLEYFAYETEVLQTFAKHYETKETISIEMIDKLRNARNFLSAMATVRQVEFALFDMRIHLDKHTKEEVQNILNEVRKEFAVRIPPEYNKFQNSFGHIFGGGYAAGYYSYKWAEVLSAHTFIKYLEHDNKEEFALNYRDIINGKGGSKKMDILFKELTGEDPVVDSLLKIDGII